MMSVEWSGKSRLERVHNFPAKALNISGRKLMGSLLDPPRMTFSQTCGVKQDWQGLAELMGLSYDEIQNIESKEEKTFQLLTHWTQKPNSTIGQLLKYIEDMERFDVLENGILQDLILRDVESYKNSQERISESYGLTKKPVQVAEVDSNVGFFPANSESPDTEYKNITIGEVKTGRPEFFDAFVCHAAEDIPFVKQLISVLEEENGLRLCIKDRDITAGSARDTVIAFLIAQRCKKMIIVLSPNFQKCPECDFMVKFGQSLCPGARSRKLVPIIIQQPCVVPEILRFITVVDHTKCGLAEWFWSRVTLSVKENAFTDVNVAHGSNFSMEENLEVQPDNAETHSDDQVREDETSEQKEMSDETNTAGIGKMVSVDKAYPADNSISSSTRPLLPETEKKKSGILQIIKRKRPRKTLNEREAAPASEKSVLF